MNVSLDVIDFLPGGIRWKKVLCVVPDVLVYTDALPYPGNGEARYFRLASR